MGRSKTVPAAVLIVGLAVAAVNDAGASDWKFDGGVTASETYTDNATLGAGTKRSDLITNVSPFISATKKGSRLNADVQYRMQNLFYASQADRNRINHQLAAKARAELLEDEVFLDANASISQQITSLLGPIGETSTASNNLSDVYNWSVSPYWQHRFGSTANLLARYRHSQTTSSASGLSNSSIDGVEASIESGTAFKNIHWNLAYSDQQTNYTSRSDVRLSSISGTLGYDVTNKFRINGTLGYDQNTYQSGGAPLQGDFWSLGASWAPSNRTSLSGTFGERFFGKTYSFALKHRTRRTTWQADYSQNVSSSSSQFSLPYGISTAEYVQSQLAPIISDPQRLAYLVALAQLIYGPVLTDQANILSNLVYLDKRFNASVAYDTAKTVTTISLFHSVRENLESTSTITSLFPEDIFARNRTIKQRGASMAWVWRMNPRLSVNASLNVSRNTFPDLGRADTVTSLNLGLNRKFNDQLQGGVNVRRLQRASNDASGDYDENAIVGTVNYTF